jgi:hypothetical protein
VPSRHAINWNYWRSFPHDLQQTYALAEESTVFWSPRSIDELVQAQTTPVISDIRALEEREAQRGNPRGLARGHYAVNDVPFFDRLIDISSKTPEDAASELARWLRTNPQPVALQQYAT